MKKQNYTAPALSVEEFELSEVICTSPYGFTSFSTNLQGRDKMTISDTGGDGTGDSAPRAKGRGIWDED